MGPHISVGEAIAHGGRRILYYAGAVLVWTVPFMLIGSALYAMVGKDPQHPSAGAALGLLAVTAIGVFLAVRFILISAVASGEPVGPIAILRRSWDLTAGNWWRLFGFLLLCMIAAMALLFAVQSVAALIARMVFGDVSQLSVGGLLVSIAGQLVSGFVSVILFVMLARIMFSWRSDSRGRRRSQQRDPRRAADWQDPEHPGIGEALDRSPDGQKARPPVSGERRGMVERAGVDVHPLTPSRHARRTASESSQRP